MTDPPLYADLAELYDLIYHDKDYLSEVARRPDAGPPRVVHRPQGGALIAICVNCGF
jgi:hypothetical protein